MHDLHHLYSAVAGSSVVLLYRHAPIHQIARVCRSMLACYEHRCVADGVVEVFCMACLRRPWTWRLARPHRRLCRTSLRGSSLGPALRPLLAPSPSHRRCGFPHCDVRTARVVHSMQVSGSMRPRRSTRRSAVRMRQGRNLAEFAMPANAALTSAQGFSCDVAGGCDGGRL